LPSLELPDALYDGPGVSASTADPATAGIEQPLDGAYVRSSIEAPERFESQTGGRGCPVPSSQSGTVAAVAEGRKGRREDKTHQQTGSQRRTNAPPGGDEHLPSARDLTDTQGTSASPTQKPDRRRHQDTDVKAGRKGYSSMSSARRISRISELSRSSPP
jgi:hypothetical protein